MSEFFAMGGYALYVWGSYGIAAAVLVGLLLATLNGLRQEQRTLAALEGLRPARRARAQKPARDGAVAAMVAMGAATTADACADGGAGGGDC